MDVTHNMMDKILNIFFIITKWSKFEFFNLDPLLLLFLITFPLFWNRFQNAVCVVSLFDNLHYPQLLVLTGKHFSYTTLVSRFLSFRFISWLSSIEPAIELFKGCFLCYN